MSNEEMNQNEQPKTNRFLMGAGCILIAAGIAVIALFGGGEKDEICTDESPIGFYEEKHHPDITVKPENDFTFYLKEGKNIFNNPKNGVKNIEEKELEFCTAYAEKYNKNLNDETLKYNPEDMVASYGWKYANAYAWYYGLEEYASLSKLKVPYIFDGGINCFTSGSQIYIKETNKENTLIPTFDLKKSAKSMEYFGIYAASAYGMLDVEFTFALLKKNQDKTYTRYDFTFNSKVYESNGMYPSLFGAYFSDFEGFDTSSIKDCSMISVSYKINNWMYTPKTEAETQDFGFIKLYEVLLPESTW